VRHWRHVSVLEPRTEGRRRSRLMSLTQERKDNVIRRVGATTGEPDVKWQHALFTPRCHVQFRL
jgi:hypothetical protein